MKNWTMVLAVMCYIVAVGAFIEGICKGIVMNGIVTGSVMWWLANAIRKEAMRYEE
jgi:hypothetical protein